MCLVFLWCCLLHMEGSPTTYQTDISPYLNLVKMLREHFEGTLGFLQEQRINTGDSYWTPSPPVLLGPPASSTGAHISVGSQHLYLCPRVEPSHCLFLLLSGPPAHSFPCKKCKILKKQILILLCKAMQIYSLVTRREYCFMKMHKKAQVKKLVI